MPTLPESIRDLEISRRDRFILYYALGIVALVATFTVLYNAGMRTLEGEDHSIFRSFQTVVETMTTTGYGADSPWDTPVMNVFVVFMQASGIAVGFFTLRLIIIPLFTGAQVNLDDRLTPKDDHVVICEYRRDSAVLLEELEELDIEYVLLSSDRENAQALSDAGFAAIHGSPQDRAAFERASIDRARAVITDAGDANVDTILTVRSLRPDVQVISLTDDSDVRDVLLETGADSVLSPHGVLGHRLAEMAVSTFTRELLDSVELGGDLEVTEVPVDRESPLVGRRLRNSGIRERTGANVIGAWIDGELQLPPDPEAIIHSNTVLLVAGDHEALAELSEFTRSPRTMGQPDAMVVAGFGEVGRAAKAVADREGVETVTIDVEPGDDVDVVGDAATEDVLVAAGIEEAGAVVVGVPDDSKALLTTVLARSLNPDLQILVRVSDPDATGKALRAGADYVLSVPRVSARMVARELLGEDVLQPASQIRLVRVPADPFAGETLAESGIYEQTGCRVIAVERDDELSMALDPDRPFRADDRLVLVGTDEAVQALFKQFDVSPTDSSASE